MANNSLFGITPIEISSRTDLSFGAKALFPVMVKYAYNEDRVCSASAETLAGELGTSVRHVRRLRQELVKAGILVSVGGKRSSSFRFVTDESVRLTDESVRYPHLTDESVRNGHSLRTNLSPEVEVAVDAEVVKENAARKLVPFLQERAEEIFDTFPDYSGKTPVRWRDRSLESALHFLEHNTFMRLKTPIPDRVSIIKQAIGRLITDWCDESSDTGAKLRKKYGGHITKAARAFIHTDATQIASGEKVMRSRNGTYKPPADEDELLKLAKGGKDG